MCSDIVHAALSSTDIGAKSMPFVSLFFVQAVIATVLSQQKGRVEIVEPPKLPGASGGALKL